MSLHDLLLLIGSGFGVGILAGFIGIGGNVVLIPITLEMMRDWGVPDSVRTHITYGTLLGVTVVTALSSTIRQTFQKLVFWRVVPWFVIGSVLSTQLLGGILKHLQGVTLQLCFAIFILILGLRWFFTRNQPDADEMRYLKPWIMILGGSLVGVISLLTGLGGGVIFIPLLVSLHRVPTKYLAGTSSAVLIFTAASASTSYLWSGLGNPDLPVGTIGFVWPKVLLATAIGSLPGSQIGAVLNKKYAKQWFKLTFALIQILMAGWMLYRAF